MEKTLKKSLCDRLGNKKILTIAVFFTIMLAAALFSVIADSDGGILGILYKADEWLELGIEDVLNSIRAIFIAIGIIGLIPSIITTIGFWLCNGGAKQYNYGKVKTGLSLLSIQLIWNTIKFGFSLIFTVVVIGLIMSIGFSALVLIIGLIILTVLVFIFIYYLKFTILLGSIKKALNGNTKKVEVYGIVTAFLMIMGIFRFIGAFFEIFSLNIFSIFEKVAGALTCIFLATTMKEIRADFRKGFAPEVPEEKKAPMQSAEKPVASQNSVQAAPQPKVENLKYVKTFSANFEEVDNRFEFFGQKEYNAESKKPLSIKACCLLKDALSDKVILRICACNNSEKTIASVKLEVKSYNNIYKQVGPTGKVEFNEVNSSENKILSEYAILLPVQATYCEIKVESVVFDDELSWDKDDQTYAVSSKEKMEFDKEQYVLTFNK